MAVIVCKSPAASGDGMDRHEKIVLALRTGPQSLASMKKVKAEAGSNVPRSPPLCWNKITRGVWSMGEERLYPRASAESHIDLPAGTAEAPWTRRLHGSCCRTLSRRRGQFNLHSYSAEREPLP